MAVTVERAPIEHSGQAAVPLVACLIAAAVGPIGTIVAAVDGWDGSVTARLVWVGLTLAWAVPGAMLLRRPGDERLGLLVLWFSALLGIVSVAAAFARDGIAVDAAGLVYYLSLALLPAAALHVLLAVPDGRLASREQALAVGAGYLLATGIGVALWSQRPASPEWPLAVEAILAAGAGASGAMSRYRLRRRGMHWAALAIAVAAEIALLGLTLHLLLDWPPSVLQVAAATTVPVPLALVVEESTRSSGIAERLLVGAVTVVGLSAVVAAVYLLVVLALGRAPTGEERTVLALSFVAAAISVLLAVPARRRLNAFAVRLAYGARQAPADVVRGFGARLSRAVPLEELLLQLAESLRDALALDAVEIWTGSGGKFERVVSEPDRGPATIRLTASEQIVVAGSGVSGSARIAVWQPQLLVGRGDALVHAAPITQAGELFGLIVAERAAGGEAFDAEVDDVLAELSRQVGLALRNVRLDSELQASLDELRRQADELRASRARVVAAADAERRRIERDLHDGAQQHLAGVAVNLRVAGELVDSDPERARAILEELRESMQRAVTDFRDLAHGVYPPLLQDRGLSEALAHAARRAAIPTRVEAVGLRRYEPGLEAAVYFCCLEALQNASKHAGASARARVRVWEDQNALQFEVADDGAGLDPAESGLGTGLTNMQDRVGAIGGTLRVESVPGGGTTVAGAVPVGR